jgi:hypothetical protein
VIRLDVDLDIVLMIVEGTELHLMITAPSYCIHAIFGLVFPVARTNSCPSCIRLLQWLLRSPALHYLGILGRAQSPPAPLARLNAAFRVPESGLMDITSELLAKLALT